MTGDVATQATGTGDQGYLQEQIDEIVSFLNDAFGGGSTTGTGTGSGSGGYSSGEAGIVENAVDAVSGIPVIGDKGPVNSCLRCRNYSCRYCGVS